MRSPLITSVVAIALAFSGPIAPSVAEPITQSTLQAQPSGELGNFLSEISRSSDKGEKTLRRQENLILSKPTHLVEEAEKHTGKQEYDLAVEKYNEALKIYEKEEELGTQVYILNKISDLYRRTGKYDEGISLNEKAISICHRAEENRDCDTKKSHERIGISLYHKGQYAQALKHFQLSLENGSWASRSNNLGWTYIQLGKYREAREAFEAVINLPNAHNPSAGIRKNGMLDGRLCAGGDGGDDATITGRIGLQSLSEPEEDCMTSHILSLIGKAEAYRGLNQTSIALKIHGYALVNLSNYFKFHFSADESSQESKFFELQKAIVLNYIGVIHKEKGEYIKALDSYQQSLEIYKKIDVPTGQAISFNNIGEIYHHEGQYAKSIEMYQLALPIFRLNQQFIEESSVLHNLGFIHSTLGDHKKAFEYYYLALALREKVGDRLGMSATLNNVGLLYASLNKFVKASESYQKSIDIRRDIGDVRGEATTLNNIALMYGKSGKSTQAINSLQLAVSIFRKLGDRSGEGNTLDSLGTIYQNLNQFDEARETYQQALGILRNVGNRPIERITLSNIGSLLKQQQQPELAIVFYKESVNLTEQIRGGLKSLPVEQQKSYTEIVAAPYRNLADLLISQGRISEAQQVLELLKIQETQTYTRSSQSGAEIALSQSEQTILRTHNTLIAFGQDLLTCQQNSACQDSNKLIQLLDKRDQQNRAFQTLIQTLQANLDQRKNQDIAFIDPNDPNNDLRRRAQELLRAQPGSLLIYPLVLDDKMWLLVASEGPILTRYEVKVTQKELADTVIAFRSEMKRCETGHCTAADHARAKTHAQKLHNWMFPKELQQAIATAPKPITNLIFAPDRSTRYLPMGALHDGKQYLAQRYSISTIVAASKTNVSDRLPTQPQVLGLGLSQPVAGFGALPSVPLEVNAIVTTGTRDPGIFSGTIFLNNDFTNSRIKTKLEGHDILHLATHGKFEPGDIDKSFLLLGDGSKFPIQQIDTLNALSGVHLVVLSACETALGDRRDQDGIEIAGISNAFLQRGAKAVIASLWQVNDPATGAYMQRFYDYLAKPNTSKVSAMQRVSRDFIDGKVQLKDLDNFRAGVKVISERSGDNGQIDLSHPYYWSAFILIGNGL